jgi:S-DNA-T family DNA segregation ATPase FtsK/SpoIIIE
VAQQREVVVEEEKRRVELHEPIFIETPPPEVPVSKKAEARIEREKQVALFPEAIGGQLPPLHLLRRHRSRKRSVPKRWNTRPG